MRFWAALGLLLLGLGCGGPPPSRFPDAASALARMRATVACSRGIVAEATVDVFDRASRVRGRVGVLTNLPDNLRLDAFSPFGINLSTLTADRERFTLFDLRERAVLEGEPSPCNLARFTQVPLPPFVLGQLFRGEAPVIMFEPGHAVIAWNSPLFGTSGYVVTLRGRGEIEEQIWMVPHPADYDAPYFEQRVRVTRVEVREREQVMYRVELAEHGLATTAAVREDPDGLEEPIAPSGPPCRAEIPRRLHLELPSRHKDVVIRLENVRHNPPLVPDVFRQVPPDGTIRREARCSG